MISTGLFDMSGLGTTQTQTMLDNISPISTGIDSGLGTPHGQSLLSPFVTLSQTTGSLGGSIGSMTNENGAYIQLARRYEEVYNAYVKEKQEHERVK
jgi:hypothetical protein